MARLYKVQLANNENDPTPYPYESYETYDEAMEAALFRAANHRLAFEVLGPDPRDRQLPLIVLNRVEPKHN